MNKRIVFIIFLLCSVDIQSIGFALQKDDLAIRFSGYIKNDNFVDSRQVIGLRDDHLSFAPAPKICDVNGRDINSRGQFQMLALETRLRTELQGPDIVGARSSGLIEVDFIGPFVVDSATDRQLGTFVAMNSIRMRHAYLQLDWDNWSIIAGQYWHPLAPPEHAGQHSVTFQTSPFEAIARQPQFRAIYRPVESVEIWGTIATQLDFKSNGPEGFSTKYMRNAIIPNLNLHLRYVTDRYIGGACVDFKRLLPRLATRGTAGIFKTDEYVNSCAGMVYLQMNGEYIRWLNKITYGGNLTDQVMFSGYGVTSLNTTTGKETYTSIRNLAYLTEIYGIKGSLEAGIIIGITKNLGAHKRLFIDETKMGNDRFIIFGRGGGGEGNVSPQFLNATDYIIGIQPRLKWYYEPFVIGAEIEILRASYGDLTPHADVVNGVPVTNVRFTLALYYYF